MLRRCLAWSGALTVMVITAVLVVLDVSDGSVHRYWSRHSFTASVLSGLLVLLLTVLIVDRVTRVRRLRGQSRAIAAQAALIDAALPRTFLETAQHAAAELFRALRADEAAKAPVDEALDQLRAAAAPLMSALDREQRAAVSSVAIDK
jgi:hypothetical protein